MSKSNNKPKIPVNPKDLAQKQKDVTHQYFGKFISLRPLISLRKEKNSLIKKKIEQLLTLKKLFTSLQKQ